MDITEFNKTIARLSKFCTYEEATQYFEDHRHLFSKSEIGQHRYLSQLVLKAYTYMPPSVKVLNFIDEYHPNFDPKKFSNFLRRIKHQEPNNWLLIHKYCGVFEAHELSKTSRGKRLLDKGGNHTAGFASDREIWYTNYSQSQLVLGDYERCIACCQEAISDLDLENTLSQAWFLRRIALSELALGRQDEALEHLLQVEQHMPTWYILSDIAEIYFDKGCIDDAYRYSIKAILEPGKLHLKAGILLILGHILYAQSKSEWGLKHYQLVKEINLGYGRGISKELEVLLRVENASNKVDKHFMRALRIYWEKYGDELSLQRKHHSDKKRDRGVCQEGFIV